MIINKIKKFLSSLLTGVIIIFAGIGGYHIYKIFKPVQIVQTETHTMRIKLESMGAIKLYSAEQDAEKDIVEGRTKLFRTTHKIKRRYKIFYEYDLKDINIISEINNKEVIMEIDPSKLYLSDLVVLNEEEYIDNTLIAPIISGNIINKANNEMKEVVLSKFKEDKEFKQLALQNLQKKLYQIALDLGFEKIDIQLLNQNKQSNNVKLEDNII